MIEMKATHRAPIKLGHTGENEAVRVAFSLLPFKETFPDGVPALLARRKGDAAAYPVPLAVEEYTAYWTVTSADTEKAGFGQCELQWIVGNTLAKSDKFDFFVTKALEAGAEAPDAPSKAWFEAIQAQIGDLSKLTTKAKEDLVAAINEAARTGGGSGGGTIEMRVSGGYIQYSSDGATWENLIAVEDLKGEAGPQGIPGEKGEAGPQGPRGETGPQGEKGLKGDTGPQGIPGEKGADGAAGKDGSDGYSPEATVTQINGGAKIIIKDKTGTTSANVMNGAQGPKGDAGPQGPKGDPGATDLSIGITGAQVGQIAKITAVDAQGKPTAWSPVDLPSGAGAKPYKILYNQTLSEAAVVKVDADADAVACNEYVLSMAIPKGDVAVAYNRYTTILCVVDCVNNIRVVDASFGTLHQARVLKSDDGGAWIDFFSGQTSIATPTLTWVPRNAWGNLVRQKVTDLTTTLFDSKIELPAGTIIIIGGK